jgi:uncharacterized protein YqfA (UPF0365 family)
MVFLFGILGVIVAVIALIAAFGLKPLGMWILSKLWGDEPM